MIPRRTRVASAALLSVSAISLGAPAFAQTANWTGFYIGLNAGGAWGHANAKANTTCPPFNPPGPIFTTGYYCDVPTAPGTQANADAIVASGSGSMSSSGFTGGFQVGHNWQTGNVVYGAEADFGTFKLSGSRHGSGAYPIGSAGFPLGPLYTIGTAIDTDWLSTVRGRLGWATSNWLVFATGGLAMTRVKLENSFSDNFTNGGAFGGARESASTSSFKTGWTIGGGAEVALNKNWSIKGEYLYVDLGSVSVAGTVTHPHPGLTGYSNGLGVTSDLTAHIARVGVNFKF